DRDRGREGDRLTKDAAAALRRTDGNRGVGLADILGDGAGAAGKVCRSAEDGGNGMTSQRQGGGGERGLAVGGEGPRAKGGVAVVQEEIHRAGERAAARTRGADRRRERDHLTDDRRVGGRCHARGCADLVDDLRLSRGRAGQEVRGRGVHRGDRVAPHRQGGRGEGRLL